jgi:hypothetical protein
MPPSGFKSAGSPILNVNAAEHFTEYDHDATERRLSSARRVPLVLEGLICASHDGGHEMTRKSLAAGRGHGGAKPDGILLQDAVDDAAQQLSGISDAGGKAAHE